MRLPESFFTIRMRVAFTALRASSLCPLLLEIAKVPLGQVADERRLGFGAGVTECAVMMQLPMLNDS